MPQASPRRSCEFRRNRQRMRKAEEFNWKGANRHGQRMATLDDKIWHHEASPTATFRRAQRIPYWLGLAGQQLSAWPSADWVIHKWEDYLHRVLVQKWHGCVREAPSQDELLQVHAQFHRRSDLLQQGLRSWTANRSRKSGKWSS